MHRCFLCLSVGGYGFPPFAATRSAPLDGPSLQFRRQLWSSIANLEMKSSQKNTHLENNSHSHYHTYVPKSTKQSIPPPGSPPPSVCPTAPLKFKSEIRILFSYPLVFQQPSYLPSIPLGRCDCRTAADSRRGDGSDDFIFHTAR